MAGGGVIDVVAVGTQDLALTESPVITFWKSNFKRYTRFAVESIECNFNGQAAFGNKTYATIQRSGDLVHKMYLQVNLPALAGTDVAWTQEIGHALIEYVTLYVGGQQIDKHHGEWLSIWSSLTLPASKTAGYNVLIGNTSTLTTPATSIPATTIYVPLQFFFNRHTGLALPLLALVYQEVKIEVSFRSLSQLTVGTVTGSPTMSYASLWVDYVFLDAQERNNFAQTNQEYLIDQIQFTGQEAIAQSTYKSRLSFNHPTKELVWALRTDANTSANRLMDFTDGSTPYAGGDTISQANLQLNGNDRMSLRDATTYNIIQPLQHHTAIPRRGIYMYSFCLNPEDYQPSGSLNFSRIDQASLNLSLTTGTAATSLFVFAHSMNIFRTASGLGGVAFN